MIQLATRTIQAIDAAIKADGGAAFRTYLKDLMPKMEDAYRGIEKPFRSHLGASTIGHECPRKLAYSFRWCTLEQHEGRTLRLFNRGHLEEARFISMLMCIGCDVFYETEEGGQFKISAHGGHFGSALDSVVNRCPDIPEGKSAYGEFKTHGEKSFKKLNKEGLYCSKFQHFVQMQMCMAHYNLEYGLYLAVNKNTDELYGEVIQLDRELASRYLKRAENIIFSDALPPRLTSNPTWYECKWCIEKDLCHGNALPRINCRTCFNSVPTADGGWSCAQKEEAINTDEKYRGCPKHLFDPALINQVEIVDGDMIANQITVKLPNENIETWGPEHITSMQLIMRGLE